MILYAAYFDLSKIPQSRSWKNCKGEIKTYWTWKDMANPDAFNIVFKEINVKEIDKENSRLLIEENGIKKWEGPWVPYAPWAYNKIDAVQIQRWDNYGEGFNLTGIGNQNKEEISLIQFIFSKRKEICTEWLIKNGVKKNELWDPWFLKNGNHATYRLTVP